MGPERPWRETRTVRPIRLEWLKRLPDTARLRVGFLYREYDAVEALKT
jgi:hypothetical protein